MARGLLEKVNAMKPAARAAIDALPDGIHTISDPAIIMAAWGARRVSGRRRGMDVCAYPGQVTAAKSLWLQWIDTPQCEVGIVIAKRKAEARIRAALVGAGQFALEAPQAAPQSEIDALLARRAELRSERRFAEADAIRDHLAAMGVQIADGKIAA